MSLMDKTDKELWDMLDKIRGWSDIKLPYYVLKYKIHQEIIT